MASTCCTASAYCSPPAPAATRRPLGGATKSLGPPLSPTTTGRPWASASAAATQKVSAVVGRTNTSAASSRRPTSSDGSEPVSSSASVIPSRAAVASTSARCGPTPTQVSDAATPRRRSAPTAWTAVNGPLRSISPPTATSRSPESWVTSLLATRSCGASTILGTTDTAPRRRRRTPEARCSLTTTTSSGRASSRLTTGRASRTAYGRVCGASSPDQCSVCTQRTCGRHHAIGRSEEIATVCSTATPSSRSRTACPARRTWSGRRGSITTCSSR